MAVHNAPLLTGRTAVVTGASGGLGAGIARSLADAGASVVLGFRSDRDAAEQLAAEINSGRADIRVQTDAEPRAVVQQVDIRDPASCQKLMQRAVDEFSGLHVVVNNAGIQPVQPLSEIELADWQAVVDTNATGTFLATQAAAQIMRQGAAAAGRAAGEPGRHTPAAANQVSGQPSRHTPIGSIIHIASIEGSAPAVGHAHYAAAKAAVIMHAKAAALEYGAWGIRVNAVSPGLIDRDGLADDWPDGVSRYLAAAPLGRLGTATDIGDACVFLGSDMARWISGVNLIVDGGISARPTW